MNDGKGNVCFQIQVTIPLDYPHSLCSIRCSAPFSQSGLSALLTSARNQAPLSSIGRSVPLNSIRISEPANSDGCVYASCSGIGCSIEPYRSLAATGSALRALCCRLKRMRIVLMITIVKPPAVPPAMAEICELVGLELIGVAEEVDAPEVVNGVKLVGSLEGVDVMIFELDEPIRLVDMEELSVEEAVDEEDDDDEAKPSMRLNRPE